MRGLFRLYHIPDNFRVTSASLYLTDNAAHWYQAFKQQSAFHTWEQFYVAVLQEFDVNIHRERMKELMLLKQSGIMEEYKQQFQQLVYHIRHSEPTISNTFLVTRFVMGLKEELRAAVEIQLPATVQLAAMYAVVQEVLTHQHISKKIQSTGMRISKILLLGSCGRQNNLKSIAEQMGYVMGVEISMFQDIPVNPQLPLQLS